MVISMKESTFYVDGMSCTGCANSITAVLSAKQGIVEAKVDFDSKMAFVKYDEKKTSEEMILQAMQEMGYGFRRQASVTKAKKA